jgi:hypothetical protein
MKKKIEELEKWREVALAVTTADSSGHAVSDSSKTSTNKSQTSASIDPLDSQPYPAPAPSQQSLLPISTSQVLQYEPSPSASHANFQPSVVPSIDDVFSLDWSTSMDPTTIPAYEAHLPSHLKRLTREELSPSYASCQTTRQRSRSLISGEDFDSESSHRGISKPWIQRSTIGVCIPYLNKVHIFTKNSVTQDLGAATASSCDAEYKGKTAFHLAAQRGQRNLVALLLPAIKDLNAQDSLGRTALHLAAEGGHSDIVVLLVEESRQSNRHKDQVIDINAQDSEGRSALHLAVNGNYCSTIAVLVQNPDIDIELKDDAGLTPLHQSIFAGHEEIVKLLIANGADLHVKIG